MKEKHEISENLGIERYPRKKFGYEVIKKCVSNYPLADAPPNPRDLIIDTECQKSLFIQCLNGDHGMDPRGWREG